MNILSNRLGFLASVALLAITASCDMNCIRGEGNLTSEDRNPGTYESVKLKIPATVKLTQGTSFQTRIEAQTNLLKYIKTNISRDYLEITSDECIGENKGITIYITTPTIKLLSIEGSGDIETTAPINTSKLELAIKGSGDIHLDATAEMVYVGIKGSGNIVLKGSSKQQFIKIDGSGNYKASEWPTENTEVNVNGSGNA